MPVSLVGYEQLLSCKVKRLRNRRHLLEVEMRIDIGFDTLVRSDDLFQVDVDKVVERVDMLLDQTLDLQECRQQLPFVLKARIVWDMMS
jgi:hypothetical protein